MDRRGFIQSVLGAAVMAVVPNNDGVELKSISHPFNPAEPSGVVGLVPVKAEGTSMLYDRTAYTGRFGQQVAEGIRKAFADHYAMEPDSFEELFIDIDDQEQIEV